MAGPNPNSLVIDNLVNDYVNSAASRAAGSVDDDPEKAGRALQLEKSTNVPAGTIYDNMEDFESSYKAGMTAHVVRNNPHLLEYINSHPMAAKVSIDDFSQLDKISEATQKLAAKSRQGPGFEALKAFVSAFNDIGFKYHGAEETAEQEQFRKDYPEWTKLIEGLAGDPEKAAPGITALIPSLVQAGRVGFDVMSRAFSGALNAVPAFTEHSLIDAGVPANDAKRIARDVGGAVEHEAIKGSISEPVKFLEAAAHSMPYIQANRKPPFGLHELIDKAYEQEAKDGVKSLDNVTKESQKSATYERSQEMVANFVGMHAKGNIGISAEAVRKLYGDKRPSAEDGKLGWIPDLEQQLAAAEKIGGDVTVPVKEWAAKVDPEIAKQLEEHLRVSEDGITLAEGERKKEIREALASVVEEGPDKDLREEEKREKEKEGEVKPTDETVPDYKSQRAKRIKGPLSEAVDAVRKASGLDTPMAEIGPRLELRKLDLGGEPNTHEFRLLDEKGIHRVQLKVIEREGGRRLHIDYVGAIPNYGNPYESAYKIGPNKFGPRLVLQVAEQLHTAFPLAEKISGIRASGGRYLDREEEIGTFPTNQRREHRSNPLYVEVPLPLSRKSIGALAQIMPGFTAASELSENFRAFPVQEPKMIKTAFRGGTYTVKTVGSTYVEDALRDSNVTPGGVFKPFFRQLRRRISEVAGEIPVHIISDADFAKVLEGEEISVAGKKLPAGGYYHPDFKHIIIPESIYKTSEGNQILLHEAIHAATWDMLDADAREVIRSIMNEVEKQFPDARSHYGFKNEAEFLSETFANKKFQDVLLKTKISKELADALGIKEWRNRSMWDGFVQWVANLLKIGKDDVTALEASLRLTDYFIDRIAEIQREDREQFLKGSALAAAKTPEEIARLRKQMDDQHYRLGYRRAKGAKGKEYVEPLHVPSEQLRANLDIEATEGKEAAEKEKAKQDRLEKIYNEGVEDAIAGKPDRTGGPQPAPTPFKKPTDIGLTKKKQERYDELKARKRMEDEKKFKAEALKYEQARQTQEWKEEASKIRGEVRGDIYRRPDIAADTLFRDGTLPGGQKVTRPKFDETKLTDEQKAALPKSYYGPKGYAPDDIAAPFGYSTGQQLIDRLSALEADRRKYNLGPKEHINGIVEEEVERRMQGEDFGAKILKAAEDHVASETQFDELHEDLHRLGMQVGRESGKEIAPPISKAEMRSWADKAVKDMRAKDVSVEKMLKLVGKAADEVQDGLLFGEYGKAYQAKEKQALTLLMAIRAKKTEKAQAQFDRTYKTFNKPIVPSVDQEYTNWVHELLWRVGKAPTRRSIQNVREAIGDTQHQTLQEFIDYKTQHDLREVPVADWLMEPQVKQLGNLTAGELEALNDSIQTLYKNGRDEKKIIREGDEADFEDLKAQMIGQLKEFKAKNYDAEGRRWLMGFIPPTLAKPIRTYIVNHLQIESLFNRWDKGDHRGVFTQWIFRQLAESAQRESTLARKYAVRIRQLGDGVDLDEKVSNTLFINPLTIEGPEELQSYLPMTRKHLRAVLQYIGSPDSLEKFARGYKVKPEQVMEWAKQNATKEDWQWAQKQGDIFADIKKESDQMYRRISGVNPENIEVRPIETPHGTFRGWYHPISYHPVFEGTSKKLMGGDALEQQGYFRATTPAGYTKARTGYAAPMDLSLDMTPIRMGQMLHDIAFREAIINASKFFYDKSLRNTIKLHYGDEISKLLIPYLKDVANSQNYRSEAAAIGHQWSEYFRTNIIGTLIGYNPGTVMKHFPTALTNSITEVGPVNFASAIKSMFMMNEEYAESNWNFAMKGAVVDGKEWGGSEELQRRMQNWAEALTGATRISLGEKSWREALIEAGSKPVAWSDLISAVPTWLAAYKKEFQLTGKHGDAVFFADRAVRRAHGSSAITSRPAIMRGMPWFASVYGFFSHIMNRQYEMMWRAKDAMEEPGKGISRKGLKVAGITTVGLMSYIIAPAIYEELVSPEPGDEKDGFVKKWSKALLRGESSSWIGIRELAYAMLNGRDPAAGLISTSAKTATDLYRDLSKHEFGLNKQQAAKTVKDGVVAFGALNGLTNAQEGKVLEYLMNMYFGKEHPKGPWDFATGMRFGQTKGHSRTMDEYLKSLGGK